MMTDFTTLACSTCRVTMVEGGGDAASWSIFFLLAVIVSMLSGIAFFMIRIARRESQHLDPSLVDNWSPSDPKSSS